MNQDIIPLVQDEKGTEDGETFSPVEESMTPLSYL
jgi:hypothetical protein